MNPLLRFDKLHLLHLNFAAAELVHVRRTLLVLNVHQHKPRVHFSATTENTFTVSLARHQTKDRTYDDSGLQAPVAEPGFTKNLPFSSWAPKV